MIADSDIDYIRYVIINIFGNIGELQHSTRIQNLLDKHNFHINEACKSFICGNPIALLTRLNSGDTDFLIGFMNDCLITKLCFVHCFAPSRKYKYTVFFPHEHEESFYHNICKKIVFVN